MVVCGLLKWYGGLVNGAWFAQERGGEWVCDGVWKWKWVIWTMGFNETWWTRGHGMFCAHEERSLLGA
jgi:hypothetical protein